MYSVQNMFRVVYIIAVIVCPTRGCRKQREVRHEPCNLHGTTIVCVPELRQRVLGFESQQILCVSYFTERRVVWNWTHMKCAPNSGKGTCWETPTWKTKKMDGIILNEEVYVWREVHNKELHSV
jgi:hypothetical protein